TIADRYSCGNGHDAAGTDLAAVDPPRRGVDGRAGFAGVADAVAAATGDDLAGDKADGAAGGVVEKRIRAEAVGAAGLCGVEPVDGGGGIWRVAGGADRGASARRAAAR